MLIHHLLYQSPSHIKSNKTVTAISDSQENRKERERAMSVLAEGEEIFPKSRDGSEISTHRQNNHNLCG
jgi:hypothetical protein